MGSKSSAPQAADPNQVADAQIRVNQQTYKDLAPYLYMDQVTPNGSLSFSVDPVTGKWTQTNALSPEAQAVFAQQNANTLLGGKTIANAYGMIDPSKRFDPSGLPAMANPSNLRNGNLQTGIDMSALPAIQQ